MNYTKNELKYAKHLLRKIGFINKIKIIQLLNIYEEKYGYTETTKSTKAIRNRKGQVHKYIDVYKRKVINKKCLEILNDEITIRKQNNEIELISYNSNDYISASDLGSFTFCNASYSIRKSFIIKNQVNKLKIDIGTKLHERLRLLFKKGFFEYEENFISSFTEKQNSILNKIKSCKLIFNGHNSENITFVNHERKFIGQPDYIFLDTNNDYFVVEEKYHFQNSYEINKPSENSNNNKDFFPSILIQLQSYVDYIKEYDCKYGILINWYYHLNDEEIIIHDFTFKVLRKNKNTELVEKAFNDIIVFNEKKEISFDNNINIKKCANCSYSFYCSHKTERFSNLQLPYNLKDLELKFSEYE